MKEGLASQRNIAKANRLWHVIGVRLQKVLMPKIRIRLCVRTDGFTDRIVCLTGEACLLVHKRTKRKQVEKQGFVRSKQVADESVVVIKFEPVKP